MLNIGNGQRAHGLPRYKILHKAGVNKCSRPSAFWKAKKSAILRYHRSSVVSIVGINLPHVEYLIQFESHYFLFNKFKTEALIFYILIFIKICEIVFSTNHRRGQRVPIRALVSISAHGRFCYTSYTTPLHPTLFDIPCGRYKLTGTVTWMPDIGFRTGVTLFYLAG